MLIHYGYENLQLKRPVVTLGIFDGVHRGHKVLLDFLVRRTKETNGESVVITFDPHPRLVLEPILKNLTFLTAIEEKKILLENSNIDHLVVIEFNKAFSNIKACDFIKDVLIEKINTEHLVMGFNQHFGKKEEGDYNTIKNCRESRNFLVEQVEPFKFESGPISSSLIREALLSGRLDEANKCLGYFYQVNGKVVQGRQIGRSIGFPTANIQPIYPYKLIPSNGVYAVEVHLEGTIYHGMLSIGTNPTVNDDVSVRTIEVNILDFSKELYGRLIKVVFRKRLRDELKFNNTAQLADQMKLDKEQTLQLFAGEEI